MGTVASSKCLKLAPELRIRGSIHLIFSDPYSLICAKGTVVPSSSACEDETGIDVKGLMLYTLSFAHTSAPSFYRNSKAQSCGSHPPGLLKELVG